MAKKEYYIEDNKIVIEDTTRCPICGASEDSQAWDFVSNVWERRLLPCDHGYIVHENSNIHEAGYEWIPSAVIGYEYISELEALGYCDKTQK